MSMAPVDWDRFQTLADGDEGLRDLVGFYIPYVVERLDALRAAIAGEAVDQVELIAHQLAGSNATAGATALVAPLLALEQMAHEGELGTALAVFGEAETAFAQVRKFLVCRFDGTDPHA